MISARATEPRGIAINLSLLLVSLGCAAAAVVGLWFGYRTWQFGLWLVSLAALLAAVWNSELGDPAPEPEPWTLAEAVTLALIVALGTFFRLYHLDNLPPGLWIDECNVTTRALELMNQKPFLPFGCTPLTWLGNWVQTSNLYLYFVILIFKVVGYGYWGIKMLSFIPGVVGVPALYLFTRELAGRWAATFAGVFLAVGHWNVRLSRWGWDEVAMTTLQILCAYFLVRGYRRGRLRDFVIAGVVMGLCLHTYIASRLALAAVLACLGLYVISRWGGWARRLQPLLWFALATVLTIAPVSIFYIQHPDLFGVRTRDLSIFRKVEQAGSLDPLWTNAKHYLLMFHVRGDIFAKHALPQQPMLDPITGALFPIGLAVCIWRWRSPGYLLCVTWLGFGLLAGILSENFDAPHAYRTGNVAPVVMAMAALPLGLAMRLTRRNALWRMAAPLAAAAVAVSVVGLNYDNFFVKWASLKELWDEMMVARGTNVARYIIAHPGDTTPYVSRWAIDAGFGVLMRRDVNPPAPEIKNWNPDYWNPDTNAPLGEVAGDATCYLNPSWKPWIHAWYPHSRWKELRNQWGLAYCSIVEIPAGDIAATHGLARYAIRDGELPPDAVNLGALGSLPGTWTVFEGFHFEREPGYLTFGTPTGQVSGIWLDGTHLLDDGMRVSRSAHVGLGRHRVAFLLPGERDHLPDVMLRRTWLRGEPIPLEAFSATPDGPRTGLRGTFFSTADLQGSPIRTVDAGLPAVPKDPPPRPYGARWEGYLHVEREGSYAIGAAMDDGGTLSLDGQPLLTVVNGYRDAVLPLAAGVHAIDLTYYDTGGGAYLLAQWLPPDAREVVGGDEWAPRGFIPRREGDFFKLPFAGTGLRARYYDNPRFEGQPFLEIVESGNWLSHQRGGSFSVDLEGRLFFPAAGRYRLVLNSDDGSWLYLDGKLIVDNGGIHGFAPKGTEVDVGWGWHDIRVRYFQGGDNYGLQLLWAVEGQEPEAILPVFMEPAT